MKIRLFKNEDIKAIDEIYRKHHSSNFSIPDNQINIVTQAVIEDNGKVIAYGMVKAFAEAILVLDLDESKKNRILSIRALMGKALRESRKFNFSQIHTFVQDKEFQEFLIKHYNFEECKGEALVLEL